MEIESAFRISLKLGEGKSPHLYVMQLKKIMEDDKSLHPMMKRTLLLLKKTRTPFVLLPSVREILIDGANFRHFDRSVEPKGDWTVTLWSDNEIEEHNKDSKEHLRCILKLFQSLGYDLYDSQIVTNDYIKSLEELTKGQIEAQEEGRKC